MLAILVNASASAVQVFALIAVVVFIIAVIVAFMDKTVWATLVCAGRSGQLGDPTSIAPTPDPQRRARRRPLSVVIGV